MNLIKRFQNFQNARNIAPLFAVKVAPLGTVSVPVVADVQHGSSAAQRRVRVPLPENWRWVAIAVFVLAAFLNYLDRQLMAALAPTLLTEFRMTNTQYGLIVSSFSMVYAFTTPFAGLFIDRVGLRVGGALAVLTWSLTGAATGFVHTFRGLVSSRTLLGVAEAAGIPSSSKASANYLKPNELGFGTAVQSVGTSLGSISAPLLVAAMMPRYGWRSVFIFSGALGLVWVLLWLFVSARIPARAEAHPADKVPVGGMLRDRRFWGIAVANALVMTLFGLWANWTTIYFVREHHLTMQQANQQFAWIPPVFATLGAFFGAWLAFRPISAGSDPVKTRLRLCGMLAPVLLSTAAIPFLSSSAVAAAAVSLSFFSCMSILVNLQMIPIDLFGAGRAAFTSAVLTCSYGLIQIVVAPAIGATVDHVGFGPVCAILSILPLLGVGVLRFSIR